MAGKFGSASAIFLVGGYNLLANVVKGLSYKDEAIQEDSDGLGDTTGGKKTPTGLRKATLTQTGGFWDTGAKKSHDALNITNPVDPQETSRVVCIGFAGQTVGNQFTGIEGAYKHTYSVLADNGKLTKANATYAVTGQLDQGTILQELEAFTQDFTGDTVDGTTEATNGAAGYVQMTDGFGTHTIKIQHSQNAVTWIDLITFTAASAPSAERKTVTGTVYRYRRAIGTVWGDLSPSASVSPTASVSPSASGSLSPSSSVSPSASTSLSPSSSLSPSTSTSISPSSSRSPSSSLSPSVSASASASPSAEAGVQGSVTVFVGLATL